MSGKTAEAQGEQASFLQGEKGGMDSDELGIDTECDQDEESAFGLYGVEDEGKGPCGGCQGT